MYLTSQNLRVLQTKKSKMTHFVLEGYIMYKILNIKTSIIKVEEKLTPESHNSQQKKLGLLNVLWKFSWLCDI